MRRSDQRPRSHTFLNSCWGREQAVSGDGRGRRKRRICAKPRLHSCMAGAHHAGAGGVHLGQVVEGQDVACLRGQIEELQSLFVIPLHTDAIWASGGTGEKPRRASIRTACTAARYTHAASTHCSTWSPAAAVHQPDPAPPLSGSTSTPDHSSEDTKTLWFKLFLPLEFTWLAGLGCGRIYHWDTSSIQVGHAEAALAHGITLSERKAQINTNPAKCELFISSSDREESFLPTLRLS